MKNRRRRGQSVLLTALLCALVLAAGVAAQTTTSSIRGVVRDDSGPVAGATVQLVNTASGYTHSATSGPEGNFTVAGLPAGTYLLVASSPEHPEISQEVQILVAQDVEVDVTLGGEQVFGEEVSVVGEAVQLLVETTTSEIATNVTPEQIETLPQNNRNFLNFAALAPGVRFNDNQDDAGQKFRSGASDARQINVFVDGVSFKNDLLQGGAFMQDSSRGNPFPQNAVQEFRVLTQNYKAEYEKAAAAVITAVTRSGGNDWDGDVFYLYQDKDLVSQDDFSRDRGEKKADYEREQWGLALGGPISRDRLHFFLSYEGHEQSRNATVLRGADFANAPANVRNFLAPFPTGVLVAPFESDLFFGKLSWQLGGGQDAYATYHRRDEEEIRGFGGETVQERAEFLDIGTDAFVARHQIVRGNLLNEAAVNWQQSSWAPAAIDDSRPALNYFGILRIGGKDATQHFEQDRIGVRDDVSWFTEWRGTHAVKAGVGFASLDYSVRKNLFENALFEFRSDEQWQFPFQARVGFGDPELDFSNEQLGLYLQDDWQVLPNLTLNLGVRWDYETNMLNNDFRTPNELVSAMQSACRTYGSPVGGQSTWCLRDVLDLDRFTTDGDDRDAYTGMVQPRLGFAWDMRGTGRTVLFGGWGKYYDRIILNDIFDEAYRQQYKIYSFCFSATGAPAPNCPVPALQWQPQYQSADALRGLVASGQAPGPEVFLIPNDMKPPRSDQFTLGVRQQLGNWLGSLAYAGVRSYNNMLWFFGDLPPGTQFNDRFGNNVGVPGYARIFTASTAGRRWYDAIYLTMDRPMTASGNWGVNLAYTYAEADRTGTDNPGEGVAFGAFDYLDPDSLYRFPDSNDERHRLVVSGTYRLPFDFQISSLLTLGSGVPFTIFDDSTAPFTVRWNEGRPPQDDFVVPDTWAYRSMDLRLEWTAPTFRDVGITLIGEAFNVFDHDNGGCFESFKPRLPNVNQRFGEPNCEFNTRRFQYGARVSF
jgi:hypothetical protein